MPTPEEIAAERERLKRGVASPLDSFKYSDNPEMAITQAELIRELKQTGTIDSAGTPTDPRLNVPNNNPFAIMGASLGVTKEKGLLGGLRDFISGIPSELKKGFDAQRDFGQPLAVEQMASARARTAGAVLGEDAKQSSLDAYKKTIPTEVVKKPDTRTPIDTLLEKPEVIAAGYTKDNIGKRVDKYGIPIVGSGKGAGFESLYTGKQIDFSSAMKELESAELAKASAKTVEEKAKVDAVALEATKKSVKEAAYGILDRQTSFAGLKPKDMADISKAEKALGLEAGQLEKNYLADKAIKKFGFSAKNDLGKEKTPDQIETEFNKAQEDANKYGYSMLDLQARVAETGESYSKASSAMLLDSTATKISSSSLGNDVLSGTMDGAKLKYAELIKAGKNERAEKVREAMEFKTALADIDSGKLTKDDLSSMLKKTDGVVTAGALDGFYAEKTRVQKEADDLLVRRNVEDQIRGRQEDDKRNAASFREGIRQFNLQEERQGALAQSDMIYRGWSIEKIKGELRKEAGEDNRRKLRHAMISSFIGTDANRISIVARAAEFRGMSSEKLKNYSPEERKQLQDAARAVPAEVSDAYTQNNLKSY